MVRWAAPVGAAFFASMAPGQENPTATQVWVDRQYQSDGGVPVNGPDEAVDVVFYHNPPIDPRRWVFATGWVTEANGATRFLTMKYNADWPEFSADPLMLGRVEWPPGEPPPAGQVNKAISMAVDYYGNIYIAGESTDPDPGQTGVDYIILKYDKDLNIPSGIPTWTYRYDGPVHGNDRPTDIIVDYNQPGVVFVTGTSWNGTDNDIVTIALDAASGNPCGAWPAGSGPLEAVGVRRYNGGGEDWGVELAGPYIACHDQSACGPLCELRVGVLGTSWDPNTQTFDMLLFRYGDIPEPFQQGVKLWEQRWIGGGDQNEYATGLAWTGTGAARFIVLGHGPPLSTAAMMGGPGSFAFSGGPPEPNYDYHLVVYHSDSGAFMWSDTVDLTGLPDYSADVQAAPWGDYQFILWATGRVTSGSAFDVGTVQWTWTKAHIGVPESLTRNWVALFDVLAGRDDRGVNAAYEVFPEVAIAGYITGSTRGASVTNDDALTLRYPQTPAPPNRPPTWTTIHAGLSGGDDAGRALAAGDQNLSQAKSSVYIVGKSFKTAQDLDFIVIRYKQN